MKSLIEKEKRCKNAPSKKGKGCAKELFEEVSPQERLSEKGKQRAKVQFEEKRALKKKTKRCAEDWFCLVCSKAYSKSKGGEVWVQCVECQQWAHEACTPGEENYICQNC